jgi:short-subunit dehydrogenase
LPYRGIYCASKFAVEGYTEALSLELAQEGIRVVIVEPGDVRTAINSNRRIVAQVSERHQKAHGQIHRQVNDEVENGLHPEKVADLVKKIVEHPKPRLRYRVAAPKAKCAYYLMRLLPDRWFESIVRKHYKV